MENKQEDTIPFYPDHVTSEAKVALFFLGVIVVIGILGTFFPVGLGPPADPMVTPEHTKPEWYFLAIYQLLKYLPKTMGAVLPILGALALTLLPFFDRRKETSSTPTRFRFWLSIFAMIFLIALTIWGEVS